MTTQEAHKVANLLNIVTDRYTRYAIVKELKTLFPEILWSEETQKFDGDILFSSKIVVLDEPRQETEEKRSLGEFVEMFP